VIGGTNTRENTGENMALIRTCRGCKNKEIFGPTIFTGKFQGFQKNTSFITCPNCGRHFDYKNVEMRVIQRKK
jgi:hypothetical protein